MISLRRPSIVDACFFKLYYFSPTLHRLLRWLYFPYKRFKKNRFNLIDARQLRDHPQINIGGQDYVKRYWKSMDYVSSKYHYQSSLVDYHYNLTSGTPFPFEDNSVAIFFSSHTLEHIAHEHCDHIFSEIFRCLKPGGTCRITVPDFSLAYLAYQEQNMDFFRHYFHSKPHPDTIEHCFLAFIAPDLLPTFSPDHVQQMIHSMSATEWAETICCQVDRSIHRHTQNHINWWTHDKLSHLFLTHSFVSPKSCSAQVSTISALHGNTDLEKEWTHPFSLFMEATKPR